MGFADDWRKAKDKTPKKIKDKLPTQQLGESLRQLDKTIKEIENSADKYIQSKLNLSKKDIDEMHEQMKSITEKCVKNTLIYAKALLNMVEKFDDKEEAELGSEAKTLSNFLIALAKEINGVGSDLQKKLDKVDLWHDRVLNSEKHLKDTWQQLQHLLIDIEESISGQKGVLRKIAARVTTLKPSWKPDVARIAISRDAINTKIAALEEGKKECNSSIDYTERWTIVELATK